MILSLCHRGLYMLKRLWDKYWTWRDTTGSVVHTLVIARIKLFLGMGYTVLQQSGVDIVSFVEDKKWKIALQLFFAWLVVDGTLAEWGRRRNADDLLPPPPPPPPVP